MTKRSEAESRPRRSRSLRPKLLALTLGVLFSLATGELVCRHLLPDEVLRHIFVDERNTFYRYDERFGWMSLPNVEGEFTRSATFYVRHNSEGFRDSEPRPSTEPTLLVVGDSMVWGYDVNREDRFTDLLAAELPEWNVRNQGVSGYGTDQELLLLKERGPHVRPRHVFLVFCENDREDNTSNLNFGNYYKPYFVERDGKLVVQGIPVPRSVNFLYGFGPLRDSALARFLFFNVTFERDRVDVPDLTLKLVAEMRRFVRDELGADFTIGLAGPDEEVSRWCEHEGVPCLDLQTHHRFPGFGRHWTPRGNRLVAERVIRYFRSRRVSGQSEGPALP